MHELYCPSCNTPSQYDFSDFLLMCPFCSATFQLDLESGQKEIFGDHYIVPNTMDSSTVKDLTMEWLKRLHHRPGLAEREFFVVDIRGFSIPYWIISLEGHSVWKGLVQKQYRNAITSNSGNDYLTESGQFRRSYRWAVSGRKNICETWGLTKLHEPQELITVEWDGFPLDSTFSRGRLTHEIEKSAYDVREFFEFKFSNGLPILGVQTSQEEALRRARNHVELYHYKLARLNVDYLIDYRTELEIAGIQLIHLPFWKVSYVYRPKTALRYFYKPKEKHLIMDGFGKGVLHGELAIVHKDKLAVNTAVCGASALLFFMLGIAWHPAFYLVALFAMIVSGASAYVVMGRKSRREDEELQNRTKRLSNKSPLGIDSKPNEAASA